VAASTVPVIRIRAPPANSISIVPRLLAGATGQGAGPDSVTTIAGTKPGCWAASFGSDRNDRRHRSSMGTKRHIAAPSQQPGAAPASSGTSAGVMSG